MLCGCISASGIWDLGKINRIMNTEKYNQVFIRHAVPSGMRLIGSSFIFHLVNDPKHTASAVKAVLK